MNWTEQISKAFSASLGVTKTASSRDVVFDNDSIHLEKVAGLQIDDLTENGIEDFMRRYLLNELASSPVPLDVQILLTPLQYDKNAPNLIQDAQGVAQVTLNKQMIELPFLIQEKELLPFDIIQFNGERCPFTRENILKIISGIASKFDKGGNLMQPEDNPYDGVEKPFNSSTVPGFLGTVMSIRDQHISRRNPFSSVITAGENPLDAMLEKTANMKEMTDEEYQVIADCLNEGRKAKVISRLQKLAAEDEEFKSIEREENKKLRAEEKVKALFTPISTIKHGSIVTFEELNGDSLTPTKAIVLKNFKQTPGISDKKDVTILLTQDGRIKILKNSENFKAIVNPETTFELSCLTTIEALTSEDIFMAIDGDDVIFPYVATEVHKEYKGDSDATRLIWGQPVEGAATRNMIGRDPKFNLQDLTKSNFAIGYSDENIKPSNNELSYMNYSAMLFTLPNAKFNELNRNEFVKRKAEEFHVPTELIVEKYINRNPERDNIFCTDRKTSVIKVTGTINHSITSGDDIVFNTYKDASLIKNNGLEKFAKLTENYIEIQCMDRSLKKYNISIFFKDDTKRLFGDTKKGFNNISEGKLKAILRVLKYDARETNRILFKSKNEPKIKEILKPSVTTMDINLCEGATEEINLTKEDIKRTFNKLVQPEALVTSLATTLASQLVVDGVKASFKSGGKVGTHAKGAYDFLRRTASESSILSSKLEKLAKDYHSKDILDLSKAMAISHYFNEKVASVVNEEEHLPLIRDVAKEIINAPVFSKIAFDISSLRHSQVVEGNEIIPNVYLKGMMNQLDSLYKVAYAVNDIKIPELEFSK